LNNTIITFILTHCCSLTTRIFINIKNVLKLCLLNLYFIGVLRPEKFDNHMERYILKKINIEEGFK